jgi:hypothetical protein
MVAVVAAAVVAAVAVAVVVAAVDTVATAIDPAALSRTSSLPSHFMDHTNNGASAPYRHMHVYATGRPRCPVCNKDVFSRSGIHPQCASERAEREAAKALREQLPPLVT